ncbi:MAG: DUF1573 domain-containing protein [Bacteroidales bacterium]|nr:DUF1573 domain-containing protein [Bacteroidales bacterium]
MDRKKIALLYLGMIMFFTAFVSNPIAVIEWNETTIDFGEIQLKKPVTVEFTFKNPGMIPIIISDVKPSCGCTVAEFPKYPIGSGNEGKIKVTYDADSPGYFSKTITVYTNTQDGITDLFIKGIVVR